jgi:hypothetical protein
MGREAGCQRGKWWWEGKRKRGIAALKKEIRLKYDITIIIIIITSSARCIQRQNLGRPEAM